MKRRRREEKGFTLIELMIVLLIAFMIIGGIYEAYRIAKGDTGIKGEIQNMSILRNKIEQTMQVTGSNYSTLANATLVGANVLPTKMLNPSITGGIVNQWGGSITVSDGSSLGLGTQRYMISYAGVPNDQAVPFVSSVGTDFYRIDVNGVTVKPVGASTIDVSTLTSAVSLGSGFSTIIWVVG